MSAPEPSIFTRIIQGDIPGSFIYRDDVCVALLTIEPISPGHTLIIPIEQIDEWWKLSHDTLSHLMRVAKRVSNALVDVYKCERVGVMIAGFEVPHAHLHLMPANAMSDLDISRAQAATPELLTAEAEKIKQHLA